MNPTAESAIDSRDWPRIEWRRDGLALGGLLLLCVVLRAMSLPASFWEWDEINFARAIHRFDVARHSPQPPGFPVFVLLSRLAWLVVRDDRMALLAVNFVAGSLLGAALYLIFREILPDRVLALAAAIAGCCAPVVLLPSVMARSDLTAMVVGLWIVWLLLRGRRPGRGATLCWLAGCLGVGVGMGIRVTIAPLAAGVMAVVFVGLLRRRAWLAVSAGAALAALGYLGWYLPTALLTGWDEYRRLTAGHWAYLMAHDSIWSSYWTWEERWQGAFLKIWGDQRAALAINGAAAFGLLALLWRREWRAVGWLLTIFVPFLAFTFIFNSPMGIVFYAMPAMPLFTTLGASGVVLLFRVASRFSGPAVAGGLGLLAVIGLSGWMVEWCGPMIRLLRREPSPPARAIAALRESVDPLRDRIYLDPLLLPHSYYFFGEGMRTDEWIPGEALTLNLVEPSGRERRRIVLLGTEPIEGAPYREFSWRPGAGLERLRPLSLGRYFDLRLSDLAPIRDQRYASGWFQPEHDRRDHWRWMGSSGSLGLFNAADTMNLRIIGRIPPPIRQAALRIRLDGREIGTVEGREIDWRTEVAPRKDGIWSMLTIEAAETFVPRLAGRGNDDRELGFQCLGVRWEPSAGSASRRFPESRFLGPGWHDFRVGKPRSWRPADRRAVVFLPPLEADAELRLAIKSAPLPDQAPQKIDILLDGRRFDTFTISASEVTTKTWRLPLASHHGKPVEMAIEAARDTPLPGENRPMAFLVTSLAWEPASPQNP